MTSKSPKEMPAFKKPVLKLTDKVTRSLKPVLNMNKHMRTYERRISNCGTFRLTTLQYKTRFKRKNRS